MIIKKFSASNFRNIESCNIEFTDGLNLLYGKNAQGKTNALEGIYIFSRGRSFRAREDADLIRFGADGFHIAIDYTDVQGDARLEYSLFGKERQRKRNGYKLRSVTEMLGSFRSVLFYPDNLEIVKGGPEERRSFLNIAISQCYPAYIKYYADYKRALENRNCLFRFMQKGLYVEENELAAWSQSLAELAAHVYIMRREYLDMLAPHAERIAGDISGGSERMTLAYECDIDPDTHSVDEAREQYMRVLTENTDRERAAGVSLYGVHRDDVKICINGMDSRLFASQGQQRTLVLALKLGEGEVIRTLTGEYPVYLFDDVLSELDEKRRSYVLSDVAGKQMIITSCESDEYEKYGANKIDVSGGVYVPSHR